METLLKKLEKKNKEENINSKEEHKQ